MNEVQKILRDTEKDYLNDSQSSMSEAMRRRTLDAIDREIEKLIKRRERIEYGLDDFMLY